MQRAAHFCFFSASSASKHRTSTTERQEGHDIQTKDVPCLRHSRTGAKRTRSSPLHCTALHCIVRHPPRFFPPTAGQILATVRTRELEGVCVLSTLAHSNRASPHALDVIPNRVPEFSSLQISTPSDLLEYSAIKGYQHVGNR